MIDRLFFLLGIRFYQMLHRAPPSALGSRPKPVGKDGCLTGLTFVLSGEFDTITKTDITDIIKTYGG
jgi:replication factor C subunit 1